MSISNYFYKATDVSGKLTQGYVSAENERSAVLQLQQRQLIPLSLKHSNRASKGITTKRISMPELLQFTSALSTLVQAKMPLDKALGLLEQISESASMQTLVQGLRLDVKEGFSLADAMEKQPKVFSPLYVSLVRAGESGGILDQLLPDLSASLEKNATTRRTVISALVYPTILLITGLLSVILLLVYVVPQFTTMFQQVGTSIPPEVEMLLNISDIVQTYGWLILVVIPIVWWGWRWLEQDTSRHVRRDASLLKVPLLGEILLIRDVALYARTLGALLNAGVSLLAALSVARDVLNNAYLFTQVKQVEEDVRAGSGLGHALARTAAFPVILQQLISVGEESGRTAQILLQLSERFNAQLEAQIGRLVNAFQPAMILFLGVVVGGIIIVMLSAVFSMNTLDF
jgi:general secretion pathway protein F